MLIFGQQDYTEKLNSYYKKIFPRKKINIIPLPLNTDNSEEYTFDFLGCKDEILKFNKDVQIISAFGAKYQSAAKSFLEKLGFKNIKLFDTYMDNKLKKIYFKEYFKEKNKIFSLIEEENIYGTSNNKSVEVYMAKSVVDKPLKNFSGTLSKYIIPIQAGAALTDKKIAEISDDTGENISEKNRRFSETTVLYWIWKNTKADYLGLCHYRRHFVDLDIIANKLQCNQFDIVLPVPTLCVRSVYEDYFIKYIPDVYPIMLKVLEKFSPEYFKASKEIYKENIFYACNMFIAKKEVLNSLCEWMFPIVFEIEEQIGNLNNTYYNRYAGFCTEILTTLYFLYNKDNLKITHADKIFIE